MHKVLILQIEKGSDCYAGRLGYITDESYNRSNADPNRSVPVLVQWGQSTRYVEMPIAENFTILAREERHHENVQLDD